MNNKVVIIGGGTGSSILARGLKKFPVDITVVVSVCDDGKSTGILRKEFDIPAVGDVRRVITALSETEPLVEKLMNYRFETGKGLKGHTAGNILLTALCNITGNMSDGIESLSKVLNLKGNVLPLTESNVNLIADMKDGKTIIGEHNITAYNGKVDKIYYEQQPVVNKAVLEAIKEADMIVLSMGSLYTSIICNLLSKDIIKAIDKSKAPVMYVCNMMTQKGETDGFTASDHIRELNKYLGRKKVSIVITNTGKISTLTAQKYETEEQKLAVVVDEDKMLKQNINIVKGDFVKIENNVIRHDVMKLALEIFRQVILK